VKPSDAGSDPKLRSLGTPRIIRVETDRAGFPVLIHLKRRPRSVASVRERWRIDDEWWRQIISREYFALLLEDGKPVTVYRDLRTEEWYLQG
jgi:hypothetical protein